MIDFDLKAYELEGDMPGASVEVRCMRCPYTWMRPEYDEDDGYDYTIAGFIELARKHDEEFHS